MSVVDRDDWPVHQPIAYDAPIPGHHWYSGCNPDHPRVRPVPVLSYDERAGEPPPGMVPVRPGKGAGVFGADGRIGGVTRSHDDYAVVRWNGMIAVEEVPWSALYPLRPGSVGECEGCGEVACPVCGAGFYPDGRCQCPEPK